MHLSAMDAKMPVFFSSSSDLPVVSPWAPTSVWLKWTHRLAPATPGAGRLVPCSLVVGRLVWRTTDDSDAMYGGFWGQRTCMLQYSEAMAAMYMYNVVSYSCDHGDYHVFGVECCGFWRCDQDPNSRSAWTCWTCTTCKVCVS